jgi:hypothetical protein
VDSIEREVAETHNKSPAVKGADRALIGALIRARLPTLLASEKNQIGRDCDDAAKVEIGPMQTRRTSAAIHAAAPLTSGNEL